MRLKSFAKKHLKKIFSLVLHNYQGQVAIFVALIFQIVFILFALMINVGLLIHHKINLQQSTDLAAYYGAMKQAEMLNVISHVNFQIRQAYKLLTWRYRILGTFGMQTEKAYEAPLGANDVRYPIWHVNNPIAPYAYDPASENFKCSFGTSGQVSPLELPYMCMNHYGFKEAFSTNNHAETFCKANCDRYRNIPFTIPQLTSSTQGQAGGYDTGIITAINTAITAANRELDRACKATAPITIAQLSKYYFSYLQDVKNKMRFMKMLMANLSTGETEQLDIEGNSVFTGVQNTFRNNLTEANNSSIKPNATDGTFETYNSLSVARNSTCAYDNLNPTQSESGNATLFAEINFKFIQYFLLKCKVGNPRTFEPLSIYGAGSTLDLETDLKAQISETLNNNTLNQIREIMTQNFYDHTVGIEKNPWCGIYYGVKASSTPIIPFLPISKVTLNAVSFAKPFGGSVGPRQYKEWPASSKRSDPSGGPLTQTDRNLPIQNPTGADINSLIDNKKILLNYSNYVGDDAGLARAQIVALYNDMLLNRSVTSSPIIASSNNKEPELNAGRDIVKPERWPSYSEWDNVALDIDSPSYDALAYNTVGNKNSFMRDIELSVVAPNQFESTYYSIEPDFYNVYVKNKLGKPGVLEKLKERAGLSSSAKVFIPKDFGHFDRLSGQIAPNFSVRNQLEVVQHVMRVANQSTPPTLTTYNFSSSGSKHSTGINAISRFYFTYIPFLPGSLLTSWTMKDLITDDFSIIPREETKSPFADCLDTDLQGGNGYGSISDMQDPRGGTEKLPPSPGNCISGGRTGYSVKIVSPAALLTETVGTVTDRILNPPTGFIAF